MGARGVFGQSRCIGESRPLLHVARPGDGPPSTDAARHTVQRSTPHRGSWSTAPSVGAGETWFEECEGHYEDYVCRGRAKRLLGRAWIFPLRRNLMRAVCLRSRFRSAESQLKSRQVHDTRRISCVGLNRNLPRMFLPLRNADATPSWAALSRWLRMLREFR